MHINPQKHEELYKMLESSNPSWLSPIMLKGIKGQSIDAFILALEGWRRGLTLSWYSNPTEGINKSKNNITDTFSLYSQKEKKIHFFTNSRGDKISNETIEILENQELTKKYLEKSGLNFSKKLKINISNSNKKILNDTKNLHYPLLIQLDSSEYVIVRNEQELLNATFNIRDNYLEEEIIVEEYIEGDEYQLYVLENDVMATTKLLPANVVGNGISTIEQLIQQKNKIRKANPYLTDKIITIDEKLIELLKKNSLDLKSVPEEGQFIQLNTQNAISNGGEPVNQTTGLSNHIKNIAIKCVQSIPGLTHAGVNVVVNEDKVYIVKISTTPDISMHVFPIQGEPYNLPLYILDYYFPESKGLAKGKERIYFDYHEIKKVLEKRIVQKLTINNAPRGEMYFKKYIVTGKVQKVGYRAWVRKQALKNGLHGFVRNLTSGDVEIVLASDDKKSNDNFKEICLRGNKSSKVDQISEYKWNGIIKSGFEIRKTNKDNE